MDNNTKECNGCKKILPKLAFYKNKTKKDGLQTRCKSCQKVDYPVKLKCSTCSNEFLINHRNIRLRKTYNCQKCVIEKVIERNKANSTGKTKSTKGYEYVKNLKEKHGYVFCHRKVMQEYLGRKLTDDEVVHHIDGDKLNNDIENLYLTDKSKHAIAHDSAEKLCLELYKKGFVDFNKETGQYQLSVDKKIKTLEIKKEEIFGIATPKQVLMNVKMNRFYDLKKIEEEIEFLKNLFVSN
jgi:hypothetical protein